MDFLLEKLGLITIRRHDEIVNCIYSGSCWEIVSKEKTRHSLYGKNESKETNVEYRVTKLENKNVALEHRIQEQWENMKSLKSRFDNIEKLLIQIKNSPYGQKS